MKEERIVLLKKKDDLELQTNELNLPPAEARERLQNRIKQDNVELKQLEKDATEMKKMVETYQNNLREIDGDMKGKGDSGEEQKYEILYQKEKEINEFQAQFEVEKQGFEKVIKEDQFHIAKLMEHMQGTMTRQHKLPTSQQVQDMKSDLKFKQG